MTPNNTIAILTARAEAAERERDELRERLRSCEQNCVPISKDGDAAWIDGCGIVDLDFGDKRLQRAEAAEAKLAKAVEALRPFADIAEAADRLTVTMGRHRRFEVVRNRISCAMVDAARATLAELTDTGGMGG